MSTARCPRTFSPSPSLPPSPYLRSGDVGQKKEREEAQCLALSMPAAAVSCCAGSVPHWLRGSRRAVSRAWASPQRRGDGGGAEREMLAECAFADLAGAYTVVRIRTGLRSARWRCVRITKWAAYSGCVAAGAHRWPQSASASGLVRVCLPWEYRELVLDVVGADTPKLDVALPTYHAYLMVLEVEVSIGHLWGILKAGRPGRIRMDGRGDSSSIGSEASWNTKLLSFASAMHRFVVIICTHEVGP